MAIWLRVQACSTMAAHVSISSRRPILLATSKVGISPMRILGCFGNAPSSS